MQVPPTQLALGQATPQPPQLKGSLLTSAHILPHMTVGKTQPISTWTEEQIPPSQAPTGQTAPQPPQLFGSLLRSTHPVPQSVRPAASQACRAGAAPARPGSQPVTVPMARRRSTGDERRLWQRHARRRQSWRCPRNPPLAPNPGGALRSARASGNAEPNASLSALHGVSSWPTLQSSWEGVK